VPLQRACRKIAAPALAAVALAVTVAPRVSAQQARTTQANAKSKAQAAPRYTAADVQFMQGMIGHHAQAIVMANMAPTHDASPQVSLFCKKILRSQSDEIDLMQTWLRDHGEPVPDAADPHGGHAGHAGMDMSMGDHSMGGHEMLMPGMLTREQLAQLDRARGKEFDRLFLTFMIQHHEGALTMVKTLFDSPGAGQTPEIFGYATGVDADQRAEIERMKGMLAAMGRD
jgi:uncharacterized protein (DUF305 family)